ncbi:tRNA lysidine(34) synthetase TilS [Rhizobium tubonense]|uniref:tRNA lysidine(34) synthetase TilS n=1 Tax=Rhizobium tubonense TaxID=484088 RepID=UPI001FCEFBD7|nr:tRNA lysidine(34) synthetase TilS [Rhizobium tubonense]
MSENATESPEAAAAKFLGSLRKPAHILVAVSGGSDSIGLLVMLADCLKTFPHPEITLSAATIDHGLRPESAAEAVVVAALCSRLGITHVTRRWEGDKPRSGLMAAAREARYELLADATADLGANVIVTAHTLDDQLETLAMRGARLADGEPGVGTGIADAVLFDRRIWVIRPLLACRRDNIRAYLTNREISWIDDPSNDDPHYERVRTRKYLATLKNLPTVPVYAGAARAAISAAAADWLESHVIIHAAALAEIRTPGLDADSAVLAYALSNLTAVLGGQSFGLGRERLRRILDFIGERSPGRRTSGGVVFDLRSSGLYMMRESRGIEPLVLAPGEHGVWDGRFEIVNGGATSVRVEPSGNGGATALATTLPKAAVYRAGAVLPHIIHLGGQTSLGAGTIVHVAPYFAPFDRFLTRFDLCFANRLAISFGRKPYLQPPLSGLLTENASVGADYLGKGHA